MIGALGALAFTAAATLTRLAPQFATGMIARSRPISSLIVEAGIRGVAVPVTAAAVGGLIGAALWFTRPASKADQHTGYIRAVLALFAAAVVAVYAALGLVDVAGIPQSAATGRSISRWQWWHFCCCGSGFISRCCTRRTTRSSPMSRCCVRTATTSFPTWRSARRAGWPLDAASRFSRKERRQTRPTRAAPTNRQDATHPRLFRRPPEPTPRRRCTGRRMSGC